MQHFTHIISIVFKTAVDALFPLSKAEQELLSYTPEEAFKALSHSTSLSGLSLAPKDISKMSSVFAYKDERVAKLVWNIKYKKSNKAISIGAYAVWRALKALPSKNIILIPMPITPKRRRERGFNQCELLVHAVKKWDKDEQLAVVSDLLIRTQHASRQTLKDRSERIESAKGIFGVHAEALRAYKKSDPRFFEKTFVVIDDVITTGSTMHEAIETLRSADFADVFGISVAH